MLSVLMYNIHYGKKLTQISQWLATAKKDVDIICLQEFPIKYIHLILNTLNKPFFDYQFALGFTRGKNKYGQLTLFNKEKLKLEQAKVIELGESFWEKRLHFRSDNVQRSSLITIFSESSISNAAGPKKFLIANTHLVCLALNSKRKRQLETIIDEVNIMEESTHIPKVLLGDFNYSSRFRQRKLLEFMGKHNFINAYTKDTHRLFLLKHQLDYVFYNKCKIEDVRVSKEKFSDHHVIEFSLTPS